MKVKEAADNVKETLNHVTYLVLIIWDVDKLCEIHATQLVDLRLDSLKYFHYLLY